MLSQSRRRVLQSGRFTNVVGPRSWLLILLAIIAFVPMVDAWRDRPIRPCVETTSGLTTQLHLRYAALRSPAPHLRLVQDDDSPMELPEQEHIVPCQEAIEGRAERRAATSLIFLCLFLGSIWSVNDDARIRRRHAWSMRVMRGEGGPK